MACPGPPSLGAAGAALSLAPATGGMGLRRVGASAQGAGDATPSSSASHNTFFNFFSYSFFLFYYYFFFCYFFFCYFFFCLYLFCTFCVCYFCAYYFHVYYFLVYYF